MDESEGFTYKDAGVDLDRAAELAKLIGGRAESTFLPDVLSKAGAFAGLMRIPVDRFDKPVAVATTDGVGTKIKIAQAIGRHEFIGQDLVAMVVNDLLPCGSEPEFMMDYIAMGELDDAIVSSLMDGLVQGCNEAGCALLGGETAEMPDMYDEGEYEVAGFGVGIIDESDIIDGEDTEVGDAIVGLASSGLHSNGFSLVRKLLPFDQFEPDSVVLPLDIPLAEELTRPTRIYVAAVLAAIRRFGIHSMAHITGGGLVENVSRNLPDGLNFCLESDRWEWPPVFRLLQKRGELSREEMLRTFNCGVGYTMAVAEDEAEPLVQLMRTEFGIDAFRVGYIEESEDEGDPTRIVS